MERYLTPPQVAKMLRVNTAAVHKWIRRGELPAMNTSDGAIRPRWKIDPADLADFKQKRLAQKPVVLRRRRVDYPIYTTA